MTADGLQRSDLPRPAPAASWWQRAELPTWLIAITIYGGWATLVLHAKDMPWFLVMPIGAYLLAWHFSLQHEAIHGWLSLPRWLRTAAVWLPIGGWLPFELYRRSHSQHHRDANLTIPLADTESVYHHRETWDGYSRSWRAILLFNQTLLGRLTIGPLLRLRKLVVNESRLLAHGDARNIGIWLRFAVGLACLLWFVSSVGGYPIWKYYLVIAYPGFSLGLLRAFIEHRWGETPDQRIASVESNWVFGALFLWNNLHIVHHIFPSMAWYEIPGYYRRNRTELLALNGSYVFPGYGAIARQWLTAPVFVPIHPRPADASPAV